MHVGHDSCIIPVYLCIGHGKQGIGTVAESGGGAKGYQSIHVWRFMPQAFVAADEKFLVDDHDDDGEQHLGQSHGDVVVCIKSRQRPVPHHMSHGEIHKNDEKAKAGEKPVF